MPDRQDELQRFQRDIDYFEAHQDELLRQYLEQWVAVLNQQVIGSSAEVRHLLQDLKERNMPIEKALIRHVTAREETFILFQQ